MIFFLPDFKSNKGNEMTGKYAVDFMVFSHDPFAEHACVFVFALPVNSYLSAVDKIIFCIDNPTMRIQTISFIVHVITHYIQTWTDGHRYVGTVAEKFDEKANKLKTSVLVIFWKISILTFYVQVVLNQFRRFQYEMIVECYRHNKYLFLFSFRIIKRSLSFYSST